MSDSFEPTCKICGSCHINFEVVVTAEFEGIPLVVVGFIGRADADDIMCSGDFDARIKSAFSDAERLKEVNELREQQDRVESNLKRIEHFIWRIRSSIDGDRP